MPIKRFTATLENGTVQILARTVLDAKNEIKKLKLKKKEHNLKKKEIIQKQKEIRANYTDKIRRKSPSVRGGGAFGALLRMGQTDDRARLRRQLADDLMPLEQQKNNLETKINEIDQVILKLELFIADF